MFHNLPIIKNLSRAQRAIAVTVSLIVVYELTLYVPLTFLFPDTHFSNVGPDFKFTNHFNLFLLGFMPAITGFFLVEVGSFFLPPLKTWRVDGKRGRRQLTKWSLIVSLILATIHAASLVRTFTGRILPNGHHLLNDPSFAHQTLLVLVPVLGFLLLCGLAELITRYGIGNGFAVIIGYGIIFSIPQSVIDLFTDYLKIENLSLGKKNIMTGEPPNLIGILIFIFVLTVLYKKFWRGVPLPVLYKRFWKSVPVLFKRIRPPLLKTKMKRKSVDFQLPYLPQGVFTFLWPYSIIMYFATLIWNTDGLMTSLHGSTWFYWFTYTFLLVVLSYLGYRLVSHPDRMTHNTFGRVAFQKDWQQKVQQSAIRSITVITIIWFFWNAPIGVLAEKDLLFGSLGLVSIITLVAILKDVFDQYRFMKASKNHRILATFDNVHFITYLKGLFEAEGIRFCVQAFEYRRLFYFFEPLVKMRVLVDSRDWKKANELADLKSVTIL